MVRGIKYLLFISLFVMTSCNKKSNLDFYKKYNISYVYNFKSKTFEDSYNHNVLKLFNRNTSMYFLNKSHNNNDINNDSFTLNIPVNKNVDKNVYLTNFDDRYKYKHIYHPALKIDKYYALMGYSIDDKEVIYSFDFVEEYSFDLKKQERIKLFLTLKEKNNDGNKKIEEYFVYFEADKNGN
ncbi:MAG: hypothetical protein ACTTID_03260 [Bacillales bacterium]